MNIHLNSSGGLTGGMFIAAMLDAFPQFEDRVLAAIDTLDGDYPVACFLATDFDFDLQGCRFEIEPFHKYFGHIPLAFPVTSPGDSYSHEQPTWGLLRQRLTSAPLRPQIRSCAMRIFELALDAESSVRGTAPDSVAFPEVAAWQALAEIVGAAALIDALGGAHWTGALGSAGARSSPAGAAIMRYVCPEPIAARSLPKLNTLVCTGVGFGAQQGERKGYLRVLCFDVSAAFDAALDGAGARDLSPDQSQGAMP